MFVEDEIRQVAHQFYAALNSVLNGDAEPMKEIWSHRQDVTALNSFFGLAESWEAVWDSWKQLSKGASGGQVIVRDIMIRVKEDSAFTLDTAYAEATIGGERTSAHIRATSVYRREDETWKMIHHSDASAFGERGDSQFEEFHRHPYPKP